MRSPDSLEPATVCPTPPVLMFTAPNPGPKTLEGTHTFLVGEGDAYVIDPGPDLLPYQKALAAWMRDHRLRARAIILTHGHPDHAPGAASLAGLLDAPVYASATMSDRDADDLHASATLKDGDRLPVDGDALRVIAAPGHTPDHVVFWLERARILFAGDVILGRGTSLIAPPEGDMAVYLRTLKALRGLGARIIAPGHGPLVHDPDEKIAEYVRHRREREEQLLEALAAGPATVQELVNRVYVDVDPRLHALAAGSVEAQLIKLRADGAVEHSAGLYRLPPRAQ